MVDHVRPCHTLPTVIKRYKKAHSQLTQLLRKTYKAVIIIFLFLPFSALVLLLVFSCSCKSIFVLNVINRLSSEILEIRVLFYFQGFPQFKYILCNKYTVSNIKIYSTKLSHCRTIPRKNAAINLECHRRHFLFEITRNI